MTPVNRTQATWCGAAVAAGTDFPDLARHLGVSEPQAVEIFARWAYEFLADELGEELLMERHLARLKRPWLRAM